MPLDGDAITELEVSPHYDLFAIVLIFENDNVRNDKNKKKTSIRNAARLHEIN